MKFYTAEDGLAIMDHMISGKTVEEASEQDLVLLAIIGDSDFASNSHFYNEYNSTLFLTSVNWLTLGAEVISIDRKVLPFRSLVVNQDTANFINYSSIALLPLLVLVVGGVIWWRRR